MFPIFFLYSGLVRYLIAGFLMVFWAVSAYASWPDTVIFTRPVVQPQQLPTPFADEINKTEQRIRQRVIFADNLVATLYRPGDSPAKLLPALVFLHGCNGPLSYQRRLAERIVDWGYLVLLVDSFAARNIFTVCHRSSAEQQAIQNKQVYDAYAALQYLSTLPIVDHLRIGVMGWADRAVLATVFREGTQQLFRRRFKAAIAVQPDCGATPDGDFVSPVLVISGDAAGNAPATACLAMRRNAIRVNDVGARNVTVHTARQHQHSLIYTMASIQHRREQAGYRFVRATYGNDTDDYGLSSDTLRALHEYLEMRLKHGPYRGSVDNLSENFDAAEVSAAQWSIAPDLAESSLPPTGYSLFDQVFTRDVGGQREYFLPFPFAELMAYLDRKIKPGDHMTERLSVALLPMGRSLQRDVAAPDFFQYPRVVVGVTRDPSEHGAIRQTLLRDRLYIGYVEKTATLEIISYNEQAGRFEYQLVKDYRPGGTPEVFYARREVCTSCHQNRAPIFPNTPWAETNSNRTIVKLLQQQRNHFYTLSAKEKGISISNLDLSVNRANFLLTGNLLWNKMCQSDDVLEQAGCRGNLYKAVLQYRLSNSTGFAMNDAYKQTLDRVAKYNWRRLWPAGLKIPFANIPDRNPLELEGAIPAILDPIERRLPESIWHWHDEKTPLKIISKMSERVLASDVERLDRVMTEIGSALYIDLITHRLKCEKSFNNARGLAYPVLLDCISPQRPNDPGSRFELAALAAGHGRIVRLNLSPQRYLLDFDLKRIPTVNTGHLFRPESRDDARAVRLPNGNALLGMRVFDPPQDFSAEQNEVWVEINESADFSVVAAAVDALIAMPGDDDPFSSSTLLSFVQLNRAVLQQLGADYPQDCCMPTGTMPQPVVEQTRLPLQIKSAVVKLFGDYCGSCHATGNQVPPSFLSGTEEQVLVNLERCAERINYRLNMWLYDDHDRKKSPMPPYPLTGKSPHAFSGSGLYHSLQAAAARLLIDHDNSVQQLLMRPYASLNRCNPVLAKR